MFGADAYPDIDTKAAALCESINRSHRLLDGHERLSWLLTVIFYDLNGFDLVAKDVDAAERMIFVTAAGEVTLDELARWFAGQRSG